VAVKYSSRFKVQRVKAVQVKKVQIVEVVKEVQGAKLLLKEEFIIAQE